MEKEAPVTPDRELNSLKSARLLSRRFASGVKQEEEDRARAFDKRPGCSPIELLAKRIQDRYENRLPVYRSVQLKILKDCRAVAKEKYRLHNKIDLEDLKDLLDAAVSELNKVNELEKGGFLKLFGYRNEKEQLVECYKKAVEVVTRDQLDSDDWFLFRDFLYFHTVEESRWPWMRTGTRIAMIFIFVFYFATVIFFCHIVDDRSVCPSDPTDQDRGYFGWLTSLYFASATISTVGYGDVSVDLGTTSREFYGVVYMVVAMLVAILAFSNVADDAVGSFSETYNKFRNSVVEFFFGEPEDEEKVTKKLFRLRVVTIAEVFFQFIGLNMLGMFVSRYAANSFDDVEDEWSWMQSFYWAVQTTTTIGYGDLDQPFVLRWFGVVYLTIGTYFVGSALGQVAGLSVEVKKFRNRLIWDDREVSKDMIHEMRSYDGDSKVDQYEFVVASLLNLHAITPEDLTPIMDKFRLLAGDDGFIDANDMEPDSEEIKSARKSSTRSPLKEVLKNGTDSYEEVHL